MQAAQTKTTSTRQSVAAEVARSDSGRYDIATLKCWQASTGGSGLATAQKVALETEAFLQLLAQPLFDRPTINVRHTSDIMAAPMLQRKKEILGVYFYIEFLNQMCKFPSTTRKSLLR